MGLVDLSFTLFGGVALTIFAIRVFRLTYQLIRPRKSLSYYGDWSVVTGSTDGIGKSIAFELAKRGQNIILVSRNSEKLSNVQKEITSKYSAIKVETCQIDLSNLDTDAQNRYDKAINGKNVGILINNAGLAYKYVNYFNEVEQERIENMISLNTQAPTILTHRTLPLFLEKKKGCIINISSAGSIVPHELHCVYSATKAYLNKFTYDLNLEYSPKGIMCQTQLPYFVVSKMSKIRKPNLTTPTSDGYAYHSVAQIGYSGQISPYPTHAIIFFVISFIPQFVLEKIIGNMHHSIMKRAKRKYSKQTKQN